MDERRRLSDILHNSEREHLERLWSQTAKAEDLKPLPRGKYRCRILGGEVFKSRNEKLGYKLSLQVIEGEHAGRRLWHDVWLTEKGMEYALRDLNKIGVESLKQLLETPLPLGIIIEANVVLRRDDDGIERNGLMRTHPFDFAGIELPSPDPFAPTDGDDSIPEDEGEGTPF